MRLLPFLIIASAILAPATSQADEKAELKKLKGDYKIVKMSRAGKDAPAEALNAKLNIDGSVFTMIAPAKDKDRKSPRDAKLDDSKTPKHITLTNEGKPFLEGIYKLEGKKLTLCFNKTGDGRPTKFESKEGSSWMVMIFEKTK